MFDTDRLLAQLKSSGFSLSSQHRTEAVFLRPNNRVGLFETLTVSAGRQRGGKWGDISCASIILSIKPGRFAPNGFAESKCLSDWSNTRLRDDAIQWERTIAQNAPASLDGMVDEFSEELLSRTAECRSAVDAYLALIEPARRNSKSIEDYSEGAAPTIAEEVRRIARTEGMICLPERWPYDLAAWLLALQADTVEEETGRFVGQSPNSCTELNWRIQLLASRLMPEGGWEMLTSQPAS